MSTRKHSLPPSSPTTTPKRIRGGGGGGGGDIKIKNDPHTQLYHEDDYYNDDNGDVDIDIPPSIENETKDKKNSSSQFFSNAQITKWSRPPIPTNLSSTTTSLSFQWVDIDMTGGEAYPPIDKKNMDPSSQASVQKEYPIIRMYGVTDEGYSICTHIHGFAPYGFFAIPPEIMLKHDDASPRHLESIRRELDEALKQDMRGKQHAGPAVTCVKYVTSKKSIMGYHTSHDRFLKIYVAMPNMIPTLKRVMEKGVLLEGMETRGLAGVPAASPTYQAFECNVPYVLRFMIDRGVSGACWMGIEEGKYGLVTGETKVTHCQIEVNVSYADLIVHQAEGEWSKIAPLRVLSIDIECQGRKGHFPEAERDPVIQVANCLSIYGTPTLVQNIFTLKGCLPIVGAQVIPSETEHEMLLKWRDFLQAADPDIITGYNVQNFDIPYLLDRIDALQKNKSTPSNLSNRFKLWGRNRHNIAKMKESIFESAAYGRRANVETTIDGRVIFDMLPYMQRNHKLSSYTLNAVCSEFLGQQKEDVHHSIISDLQNGSDDDRHRLAVYCLKDALLPLRLMEKLSVLVNYIEMARVTGVPMNFLITRGQQIKVFSMILRKCRDVNLLVPTLQRGAIAASGGNEGYEGATVLEPIRKYYEEPIATLDFASLYPSIMQAWNLCYSTLVSPKDISSLEPSQYERSENGHVFVTSKVKKGILPTILSELLAARKRAKRDMKNAPTEFERAVQNGRQLALKVSANSVYGFTGAGVGQLPCLPIASSVTSYGRVLLERTKEFVEETFTKAKGYDFDAQVIYGDTDSVMVKFGKKSVEETFPLAIEAAEKCSKIFPDPILLEFEKVYFPYLLMNKKRYAGLMWTNVEKHDYMDTKGLETVRRDNCALVREVIQTSLDTILIKRDVPGAIAYVKSQISDLLQNKMDISRLVITKSLNKGAEFALGLGGKKEDYKVKQAHVELAARMKARDAGSAPQMGDRVPYVIVTAAKNAATYEKSEDPIYVLENNVPIDCKWYLTNQLSKPLTRIFEPIIGDVQKVLLQGDHTRKIFIPTPAAKKGSLMMFAVKGASCLGCRCAISGKGGVNLCSHCQPRIGEIYLEKMAILREKEEQFASLWAKAQLIHGTVHSDVICTGDGCACEFYRRKKVQADIRRAMEVMEKFGTCPVATN